jgi:hypothetical protein
MVRKAAVIYLVCFATLAVIWAAPRIFEKTLYHTVSPNQQYRVGITQAGSFLFDQRAVYLNAFRNGETVVKRKLLYTGDFLDSDFRDLYPNPRFRSNSIYELGGGGWKDVGLKKWNGDLKISNETSSPVSYLLIETGWYKLVFLDVEPRTVMDLSFQYSGWVSCQGQFAESKKRFASAVGVVDGSEREVTRQFSIRIKGDTAIIESPQPGLRQAHCCASDRPDPEHEWSY